MLPRLVSRNTNRLGRPLMHKRLQVDAAKHSLDSRTRHVGPSKRVFDESVNLVERKLLSSHAPASTTRCTSRFDRPDLHLVTSMLSRIQLDRVWLYPLFEWRRRLCPIGVHDERFERLPLVSRNVCVKKFHVREVDPVALHVVLLRGPLLAGSDKHRPQAPQREFERLQVGVHAADSGSARNSGRA
ncbi:Uncharacterised protein [Mycobacterium tuberculosis]|nr:Uncharacterised protein [Mycobacterium tuberculosis]COX08430.1 Uncharacterised protein [Mycobacterium tuberculosis]COX71836.1 Uncharacterised protein [Mycobacterium tuberculosis]